MQTTSLKKLNLSIKGMDCADCALHVEKAVLKLTGVHSVSVNFMSGKLQADIDPGSVSEPEIFKAVKSVGYAVDELKDLKEDHFSLQGMKRKEIRTLRRKLKRIPGIEKIVLDFSSHCLTIQHKLPDTELNYLIKELGLQFLPKIQKQKEGVQTSPFSRKNLILTILAGIFATTGIILQQLDLSNLTTVPFFLLAVMFGGYPFALKGLKEARHLTLGMNFLMSVAVMGAMFIGEWAEAAMVVFLFSLAQLLESVSIQRARRSIQSLINLAPNVALCKTDSGIIEKPVEQVSVHDIILIKPGNRIPLDGEVMMGSSRVNQAPITGESMPVEKQKGDLVFAGTLNQDGALEIRVTKPFKDSTLSRIIHLVEEAQAQRAPVQQIVEKFARIYTPAVVIFAFLVAITPPLVWGGQFDVWFYRALVLLVISCPCALVISTPVTLVSALTNAARLGILIKGGAYLENFHNIKVLAFDKTGTLTYGKPSVVKTVTLNGFSESEVLKIAASLETNSEHAMAAAIMDYATGKGIIPIGVKNFKVQPGMGAEGNLGGETYYIGNHRFFEENGRCDPKVHPHLEKIEAKKHTAVILGNSHSVIAVFSIADEIRPEAPEVIRLLRDEGISKTIMLTGDNQITAASIASVVDMDEVYAELLPENKVETIRNLKNHYKHVGMVGDGVNDAPALAMATIGVSMGVSGSDAAIETSDISLMKDNLFNLVFLKKLSHKTSRIVRQNIFLSLFLKAVFLVMAIPGFATLWMAVFADMGASLMVIFNGLRALHIKRIKDQ
jgi:Cd2+/Zn2+-exporting ATPase